MSDRPKKEIVTNIAPETVFGIAIVLVMGTLILAGLLG